METSHINGMITLQSLAGFMSGLRQGNTIPLYLSMAMTTRLKIDTAVEISWKKDTLLQRKEPKSPLINQISGPSNISVICRGTAETVINISETAMLAMR